MSISGENGLTFRLKNGVPQGSNLAPILFIIYVNGLQNILKYSKIYAFTDDVAVMTANSNIKISEGNMQKDLIEISKWAHENNLVINTQKTKCMFIKTMMDTERYMPKLWMHSNECAHYMEEENKCPNKKCERIDMVREHKYLGVIIDENLRWNKHAVSVERKMRAILPQLYMLKNYVSKETLKMVYYALIDSRLRYGIQAWGLAKKSYTVHIDRVAEKMPTNRSEKRLLYVI